MSNLRLGDFIVPEFDGMSAAFGADLEQYPRRDMIKKVDTKYSDICEQLFFNGGKLSDYNLRFRESVDDLKAMIAIKSWLRSFEPKHEHKTETVAWALSEWCEPIEEPTQ